MRYLTEDQQQAEKYEMGQWLKEKCIHFEFTNITFERALEISLIAKKNNCLLVKKKYPDTFMMNANELQQLVYDFEENEVSPLLFDWWDVDERDSVNQIRLIRED